MARNDPHARQGGGLRFSQFTGPAASIWSWWYFNREVPWEPMIMPNASWQAGRSLLPWEQPRWSAELLDTNRTAYRIPNFLSAEECEHIISDVAPKAGFHVFGEVNGSNTAPLAGAGLAHFDKDSRRYLDALNWTQTAGLGEGADPKLMAIERRIAELTAIPWHDDETPLMLSVSTPWAGESRIPMHHDHNMRGRRTVSVVMYCSGGDDETSDAAAAAAAAAPASSAASTAAAAPKEECDAAAEGGSACVEGASIEEVAAVAAAAEAAAEVAKQPLVGGAEFFPCLDKAIKPDTRWEFEDVFDAPSPPPPSVCKHFERLYRNGKMHLGYVAGHPEDDPDFADLYSPPCVGHDKEGQPSDFGVLVEPRRGDALLYLSVQPGDGTVLPRMFHAPCHVSRGTKVQMAKYKEVWPPKEVLEQWEAEDKKAYNSYLRSYRSMWGLWP